MPMEFKYPIPAIDDNTYTLLKGNYRKPLSFIIGGSHIHSAWQRRYYYSQVEEKKLRMYSILILSVIRWSRVKVAFRSALGLMASHRWPVIRSATSFTESTQPQTESQFSYESNQNDECTLKTHKHTIKGGDMIRLWQEKNLKKQYYSFMFTAKSEQDNI